jgi:hypothetical protein
MPPSYYRLPGITRRFRTSKADNFFVFLNGNLHTLFGQYLILWARWSTNEEIAMKRLILAAVVFSSAMLANAQTAEVPSEAKADETIEIKAEDAKPETKKLSDRNCIRHTGTHIAKREKDQCTGAAGRSYDREDIERTGEVDIGRALERLDPSISIRR